MTEIDTSGKVATPDGFWTECSDLDAFTQGYVSAVLKDAAKARYADEIGKMWLTISDLAPETLARIIADCERRSAPLPFEPTVEAGRKFWELRQANQQGALLPPLTVQLGEDGKLRFAA